MLPRATSIKQSDTHRLIPAKYIDRDETVLARLTRDRDELKDLFALEGATNDRLIGEAGLLPGITLRELLGQPFQWTGAWCVVRGIFAQDGGD
jgi:hypothetical protein